MTARSRRGPRNPTEKAADLRRAMEALLAHGSTVKAARATGIPQQSISRWKRSEDGKRVIAEIRAEASKPGGHAEELFEIMQEAARQIKENLLAKKYKPGQLPFVYGVLSDKHARLVGPKQEEKAGPVVFEVVGFSPSPVIDVKSLPDKKKPARQSSDEADADDDADGS